MTHASPQSSTTYFEFPPSTYKLNETPGEAGSLSSDLLMCGGGVRSILLLSHVARCLETIDVCIWNMFVFMSVVVTI